MAINTDLIDELLKDYKQPDDVLGENGLLKQLAKAALERAMQAELACTSAMKKMIRTVITSAKLSSTSKRFTKSRFPVAVFDGHRCRYRCSACLAIASAGSRLLGRLLH
jgi:hypothetical protein